MNPKGDIAKTAQTFRTLIHLAPFDVETGWQYFSIRHARAIIAAEVQMNSLAQSFLSLFDLLPEEAKHDVTCEIIRRARDQELPPLTDEERAAIAAESFRELDLREMSDDRTESRRHFRTQNCFECLAN